MTEFLHLFPQEKLLGRLSPSLGLEGATEWIAGRRVAVTGAAGSVGGPLVQQLLGIRPAELLLLDHHEHTLFRLRQQLGPDLPVPIRWALADVRDRRKLELLFSATRPEVVFHLAAYKHVPLGEENPDQTVEVNLSGTRAMIEAAAGCGAARFVYPSSDKAIDPPSVYGGTKKIAEALTLAADRQFAMGLSVVRFVNIVGTRGSVIETLSAQITAGKPLTLTDPNMTRYWITMPEATRLLIQAAAAPESGAVFMPDTGPALPLVDLARRLAHLLTPDGRPEGQIRFIGRRPGERLHEILLSGAETFRPSGYPGILRVETSRSGLPAYDDLSGRIDLLLETACRGELLALRGKVLDLAQSLQ